MDTSHTKLRKRAARHARIRARVIGTAERPRLSVFRSNRFVYVQLIDDQKSTTLLSADSRTQKGATPRERAEAVGTAVATLAKEKGITKVVFDRGGFRYMGTIAALADAARAGGLEF